MNLPSYKNHIFNINAGDDFSQIALDVFHYQYHHNKIYNQFVDALGTNISAIQHIQQIPFLPIRFFKTQKIIVEHMPEELVFESSGTTGANTSKHYVASANLYEQSFLKGWEYFFGNISNYTFFALLPSYLERGNSSLVYMVEKMLLHSNKSLGGFYLHETGKLAENLEIAKSLGNKIVLIGVTFALLDLIEKHSLQLPDAIIIETGGMKGRRKELTREELHQRLSKGFGVENIYSEYGMTELLSQAWSKGNGIFNTPPWMKIQIADINDPLHMIGNNVTGGINVIDLANIYSCSFIATSDLGKTFDNGSFEVLGRFDNSEIRGCSLLTV